VAAFDCWPGPGPGPSPSVAVATAGRHRASQQEQLPGGRAGRQPLGTARPRAGGPGGGHSAVPVAWKCGVRERRKNWRTNEREKN